MTGCREARQLRLQHCQTQIINPALLFDSERWIKRRRLRNDAMQMNAGTITKENFLLFCILQPVPHFGINGGLQLCEVIQDLL